MWLEDHFGGGSMLQRNERVKLAASFWNNIGAGMVVGGMAAAFFLDKPQGTWTKIGIAIAGLVLGWLCYSIASNILTYMHTAPEERAAKLPGGLCHAAASFSISTPRDGLSTRLLGAFMPRFPSCRSASNGRMTQNRTPLFLPTCLGAQAWRWIH
jgi:hypothetical protein